MHRGHLDSDWVEGLGFRVWGVESGGGGSIWSVRVYDC